MITLVKGLFHFTRLGKTGSWFLSILLTPYQTTKPPTKKQSTYPNQNLAKMQ